MSGNDDSARQGAHKRIVKTFKFHAGVNHPDVELLVRVDEARQKIKEVFVTGRPLSDAEREEVERQIRLWSNRYGNSSNHDGKMHMERSSDVRGSVNKAPEIEVPPSSYLYGLGRLLDKSTREMVFKPLIDDFHHEYFEALMDGQPTRRLIWVYRYHGTVALRRALCLGFLKQLVSGSD